MNDSAMLSQHHRLSVLLMACISLSGLFVAVRTASAQPRGAVRAAVAKTSATNSSLPDWSGIWLNSGTPTGKLVFWPFDRATADPPGLAPPQPGDREHPPYKPEWDAKYGALLKEQVNGKFTDPETNCLPAGFPRLLAEPYHLEIIVTPRQTWMIFEQNTQVRRIYTDGRPHPPQEDLFPMWNGHSIGHWEGQVLVVDTVSLRVGQYDRSGAPFSDQIHVTERIHSINNDTIEDDVTIEDPVTLARPWNVTRYFRREKVPAVFILDWSCEENNRNFIEDGKTQVLLPGDPGYERPR
jgi:hypothetical protein